MNLIKRFVFGALFVVLLVPSVAFADTGETDSDELHVFASDQPIEAADNSLYGHILNRVSQAIAQQLAQTNKVLPYDRSLIDQIGTQATTGHGICCPGFACAYGDAIIDGTVNSHAYYGCGTCRWTDWGGGNSSFRSVDNVLREAYDQILAGKPTVIHVSASYGQHWITLIGYQDVYDPNNLTLSNFIALDPWDGSQIVASDRFRLYGDGCEHISDRQLSLE